jgi:hypothetical protein
MASAELSRRVGKVVGYPPLCDLSGHQRREFHEALLDADAFEDLPGKWRAAILKGRRERAQSADRRQRLAPGSSACPPALAHRSEPALDLGDELLPRHVAPAFAHHAKRYATCAIFGKFGKILFPSPC